jgi:hypothetical protein
MASSAFGGRRKKYCHNGGMAFAPITPAATEIANNWCATEGVHERHRGPYS